MSKSGMNYLCMIAMAKKKKIDEEYLAKGSLNIGVHCSFSLKSFPFCTLL